MNRRGGRGHKKYRAKLFRMMAERLHHCEACGRDDVVHEDAHPDATGERWCLEGSWGSLEEPPREVALEHYGALPDFTPWDQFHRRR